MPMKERLLKLIDRAVEYGQKYGLHVSLNFHRIPGYCVNERELEPQLLFDSPHEEMKKALPGNLIRFSEPMVPQETTWPLPSENHLPMSPGSDGVVVWPMAVNPKRRRGPRWGPARQYHRGRLQYRKNQMADDQATAHGWRFVGYSRRPGIRRRR
jgi:hypothetical protein